MTSSLNPILNNFVQQHALSATFKETACRFWLPLCDSLDERLKQRQRRRQPAYLLGINGCQGSGKSTLAALMAALLAAKGWRVVNLSMDDFYLTHQQRHRLAEQVHPLLQTRGVPGTHDIRLLRQQLMQLRQANETSKIAIPRFDKLIDDRCGFDHQFGTVDIIILEGWCLAVPPQPAASLITPINALETDEDRDGRWRRYVNRQLAGEYQRLSADIDDLLWLRAPNFTVVAQWRLEQEQKLVKQARADDQTADQRQKQQQAISQPSINQHGMNQQAVNRFIQYYQRLTEYSFATLEPVASWIAYLDHQRSITHFESKPKPKNDRG